LSINALLENAKADQDTQDLLVKATRNLASETVTSALLIGDNRSGGEASWIEQFTEKLVGCHLVAAALQQDIDDLTICGIEVGALSCQGHHK
jgi:hypothetical protein